MEWKPISPNSNYEISDTGVFRKIVYLTPHEQLDGKIYVEYTDKNGHNKAYIHDLVMKAFKPDERNDRPHVIHKDKDFSNNNLDNLDWSYENENINNAIEYVTYSITKICQYDLDDVLLNEYSSLEEAAKETGLSRIAIKNSCDGDSDTCGGYVWRRVEGSTTISRNKYSKMERALNRVKIQSEHYAKA